MSTPFAAGAFLPRRSRTAGPSLGKRHRKLAADEAANLRLTSAGTGVPVKLAVESPTLMGLVVEDLCWQLGVAQHADRRPSFWHRTKLAAWKREHECWELEREYLADMTREAITAAF